MESGLYFQKTMKWSRSPDSILQKCGVRSPNSISKISKKGKLTSRPLFSLKTSCRLEWKMSKIQEDFNSLIIFITFNFSIFMRPLFNSIISSFQVCTVLNCLIRTLRTRQSLLPEQENHAPHAAPDTLSYLRKGRRRSCSTLNANAHYCLVDLAFDEFFCRESLVKMNSTITWRSPEPNRC